MATIKAYRAGSGETYNSYEDLITAETNGWLVLAVVSKGAKTWPAAEGPYEDKNSANRAANRLRNRWRKTARNYPGVTYRIHVRPAWKELG